ncbi:hypothetical protein PQI07_22705 [Methylobacterium sp. 092160098-2]|uniref:hypothetical protein n=1 Tax=Methylobacterium sp. 092160098-2 TaxID=3025129 RepID=UPI002381CD46|nr:hypothetical protein [Methylobacterium sp. 092160098-2]MDE4913495.1 hypothetical protein [Methylobacterium sp. 092160098-2]
MERMELLDELRRSFVLITLTHRDTNRLKCEGLSKEQRKSLVNLHGEIVGAFHDNSIAFGKRRAVPMFMVPDLVETAGKGLAGLKQQLAGLTPDAASEFSIGIRYEPVPAAEPFENLPDRFRLGFTRLLVDGAVRDYETGMEEMLLALHSAASRCHARWSAYHDYIANPLKGERMLVRESVNLSVAHKARVLRAANVQQDRNIDRFCAMAEFAATDIKELRQEPSVRLEMIEKAHTLVEALRGYLNIGTGGDDTEGDEE